MPTAVTCSVSLFASANTCDSGLLHANGRPIFAIAIAGAATTVGAAFAAALIVIVRSKVAPCASVARSVSV